MQDYSTPEKMFELINNSTYIQNINTGVVMQPDSFGAKTQEAMAYSKDSIYNKANTQSAPNTKHADMTKPQSNSLNPGSFL